MISSELLCAFCQRDSLPIVAFEKLFFYHHHCLIGIQQQFGKADFYAFKRHLLPFEILIFKSDHLKVVFDLHFSAKFLELQRGFNFTYNLSNKLLYKMRLRLNSISALVFILTSKLINLLKKYLKYCTCIYRP